MADYKRHFSVSLISIAFTILFLTITVLGYLLFFTDVANSPKGSGIISGLFTGFIIAACQLWLSWYEFKKIDEYKELRIIRILQNRKDPIYYGNLISKSKKRNKVTWSHRFKLHRRLCKIQQKCDRI